MYTPEGGNIFTCMIEKDYRSTKFHRLQVIHLYECNLNLLLGLYMQEIDQHCEDNYYSIKDPTEDEQVEGLLILSSLMLLKLK